MKDNNLILDPVKSIVDLTYKMEQKKKFAYVNISRSAINLMLHNSDKKPPKYFVKSLTKCMNIQDPNFLKAIPVEFSEEIEQGKLAEFGLQNGSSYYDAGMFEYFFANKKEVIDIFINHYIRESKNVVLSFHDKKTVQKVFGQNQYVVSVPYNNYYDKLDSIVAQVSEFEGGVDSCILDCPMLATAVAPKLWENLDMSILDFGKIISSVRFLAMQNAEKEKSDVDSKKKFYKKRNEKR
jgi:hypothetical protein